MAGKKQALRQQLKVIIQNLKPLDHFESTDPLTSKENPSILCTDCYIDANNLYENQRTEKDEVCDQENKWEHPDFDNNIFEIFDDKE